MIGVITIGKGRDSLGDKVRFSDRDGSAKVSSARDRHTYLRSWLPIRIVIIREGDLRHGVIATFPLRGALGHRMRKENMLPVVIAGRGSRFLTHIVGILSNCKRTMFQAGAVPCVECGPQETATQGTQGIPLGTRMGKAVKKD